MSLRRWIRDLLGRSPLADGLVRRFVWSRLYFPEVEMRFLAALPKGSIDVAVDVGAATGSYAWILNRKSQLVFAFEPGETHGRYLERVTFGTRIRVIRAAVGRTTGNATIYTPGSSRHALHSATLSAQNPVVVGPGAYVEVVRLVALDQFVATELGADRSVDLLKIDVEGYELEVLQGADALLRRHRPLVICEIEQRHNPRYRDVFAYLRTRGYHSYILHGQKFVVFEGDSLDELQSPEALAVRLSGSQKPTANAYFNNFVFQHPHSRLKVGQ